MTISDYNSYIKDLCDEIEKQRKEVVSGGKYIKSNEKDKNYILKKADEKARKAVKEKYLTKYRNKFKANIS